MALSPSDGGAALFASTTPLERPDAPRIEIRLENVSYTAKVPRAEASNEVPSVARTAVRTLLAPAHALYSLASTGSLAPPMVNVEVLKDVSGVLKPGTLTLVLAPAGHGKSAWLKAVAKQLPAAGLSGRVTYSGSEDGKAEGANMGQLAQYTSQLDEHNPYLTVRQTLDFVHANGIVDPAPYYPHLAGVHEKEVQGIIDLLKLGGCAGTIVGNELLRGVSGGEKKRVTIAEGLLSNAPALCLDELSNGLDSSTTFQIVAALKARAKERGLTIAIALLQPTPETFMLFDEVVLLREGCVVYHGPKESLPAHFASLGFVVPPLPETHDAAAPSPGPASPSASSSSASSSALAAATGGAKMDVADWCTDMLNNPLGAYVRGLTASASASAGATSVAVAAAAAAGAASPTATGTGSTDASAGASPVAVATPAAVASPSSTITLPANAPISTEVLAAMWKASPIYAAQMAAPPTARPLALTSPWARQQFGHAYCQPYTVHLRLLLARQFLLLRRNPTLLRSKLMGVIIMAIVLGGLYYQSPLTAGASIISLCLNLCMNLSFMNMAELSTACEAKYVAYKHTGRSLYPGGAFVLASAIAHMPVSAITSMIFLGIIYPMVGLASGADRFFSAWIVIYLIDLLFRNTMVCFAYAAKTLQKAQSMPMPLLAAWVLFSGTMVTPSHMGWLIWIYYSDPFAYAVRSLAQNEFLSPKYAIVPPQLTTTLGIGYLDAFGFQTNPKWQWGGVGFVAAFFVLVVLASVILFNSIRYDRSIGSRRDPADKQAHEEEHAHVLRFRRGIAPKPNSTTGSEPTAAAATVPVSPAAVALTLPTPVAGAGRKPSAISASFKPCTLVWKDITYTVPLPKGGSKTLLHGISGCAVPGQMLALMGASGAGKTTLLDVLSSRKNSGKMDGAITINGFPKDDATFLRITGYIEQVDNHAPLATVREAISLSAEMRLPSGFTKAERDEFVDEILELLELTPLANRIVGVSGGANSLAPAERKRLTIAVELASNAPIIFADEPSSGLSSSAAAVVMRALKRVCASGRTVVATIHQPSADLFGMFDALFLMQRGGYVAYSGPLGPGCSTFVRYLESVPGVPKYPGHGENVANWMLQALLSTPGTTPAEAKAAVRDDLRLATARRAARSARLRAASAIPEAGSFVGVAASVARSGFAVGVSDIDIDSTAFETVLGLTRVQESGEDSDHEDAADAARSRAGTGAASSYSLHAAPSASASTGAMAVAAAGAAAPAIPAPAAAAPVDQAAVAGGLPGPDLQARLLASDTWAASAAIIDANAKPAPGATAIAFPTLRARSWGAQYVLLLRERWLKTLSRDIGYSWGRLSSLVILQFIFGIVWLYAADSANSVSGVQTLTSAIMMTACFTAMISLNLVLPFAIGARSVFYRETSARMYAPLAYTLSHMTAELPWLALVAIVVTPISYFMIGLSPDAGIFFFHYLCVFIACCVYWCLGLLLASALPAFEAAQAMSGLLSPLFFLFSGMWAPRSQIVPGASWFCVIDPLSYLFGSIESVHFYCNGPNCPTISLYSTTGNGTTTESLYGYVSTKYEYSYENRWNTLGYLTIFVAVFGIAAAVATAKLRYIVR